MSEQYWSSLRSFLLENGNYLSGMNGELSAAAGPSASASSNPVYASTTGPSLLHMAETPVSSASDANSGAQAPSSTQPGPSTQANLTTQANLGTQANVTAAPTATPAGHTYYVATTGSDSNSGTSTQPFLTLQKAADIVKPGDTVIVRDGVYSGAPGGELVVIRHSGTADAPITFQAEHKGGAQLDGHNNAIAVGVKFEGSSYVNFENFDLHGFGAKDGGGGAFWIDSTANHIHIGGNNMHDLGRLATDTHNSAGFGIFAEGDYFTVEGNTFSNIGRFGPGENGAKPTTTAWQTADHGIYLLGTSHVDIINNTFMAHEHGWAIQVYGGTTSDLLIANNAFSGANPNKPGQIMLSETIQNAEITHNTFDHPLTAAIEDYTPNFSNVSIHDNATTANAIYDGAPPSGVKLAANETSVDPLPTQVGDSSPPPSDPGTPPPPDHITGTNGSNHLVGTEGAQTMDGLGGRDWLEGRGGNDQLNGGAGQDKLDGGAGNDVLQGGAGKDQFIFQSGSGKDVITDFESRDTVTLSKAVAGAVDYNHLDFSQTDKGVVLTLADGGSVTFEGLSLHDLDQHNFMLIA